MKKTALVIMAAGIGSRFGKGIKQLEPVGPNGEIIMDYSIHDALEAGFDKVVFIIRKDLEEDFRRIIGNRIEKLTQVQYAFQALEDLPEGFVKPKGRTKPWGTGQAVLCCKDLLEEPFVVINADDYYGKEPYVRLHEYLVQETGEREDQIPVCMAGFTLGNTLSDNGGVTRGICQMDGSGRLTGIRETKNIVKTLDGAAVEGPGGLTPVDVNSKVSMNMWGLTPAFLQELETGFVRFLKNLTPEEEQKAEYLLPTIIDGLIQEGRARVKVIDTDARWFGVTYQEDKEAVVQAIRKLIQQGVYQEEPPGEGLPGEEHRHPVGQLRQEQQGAEGLEQGQVPQLPRQPSDGVEDEQVAHPVGKHIQPVQVEVQQDEQVAPGNVAQGPGDERILFRHGRTSEG